MTIQYLLAAISLQREAIEKAEAELQKKERNLRELILAQLRGNGLNYAIVAERMGVQIHALTNFFCNGQAMKPATMKALLEAIKSEPTQDEMRFRRRRSRGKRPSLMA